MSTMRYTDALADNLTTTLDRLQSELTAAATTSPTPGNTNRGGGNATLPAPSSSAIDLVDSLSRRIDRMQQIRNWIDDDHELARLIDDTIGQQVKLAERRQNRFAILLNVVFLFLGWLLSVVGQNALNLFNR